MAEYSKIWNSIEILKDLPSTLSRGQWDGEDCKRVKVLPTGFRGHSALVVFSFYAYLVDIKCKVNSNVWWPPLYHFKDSPSISLTMPMPSPALRFTWHFWHRKELVGVKIQLTLGLPDSEETGYLLLTHIFILVGDFLPTNIGTICEEALYKQTRSTTSASGLIQASKTVRPRDEDSWNENKQLFLMHRPSP